MNKKNHAHQHIKPTKQRNWQPWELKILLLCHERGITCGQLSNVLPRSADEINRKSCMQGVILAKVAA